MFLVWMTCRGPRRNEKPSSSGVDVSGSESIGPLLSARKQQAPRDRAPAGGNGSQLMSHDLAISSLAA